MTCGNKKSDNLGKNLFSEVIFCKDWHLLKLIQYCCFHILPFLSVTPFRIITIVLLFDTVCLRYTAEKVTNTQGDFRFYIFSNQSIFLSLCRIQSFHFIFKNVSNIQSSSNKVSNTRSFSKKISCSRSYPKNVYNLWSFLNKVLNDNSQS